VRITMMQSCVRWLVTLALSASTMAVLASPAHALPPWIICAGGENAARAVARSLSLEPANGATVPAGPPVTFSGESGLGSPLTFSVASSEALLSSPDIDSGTGSQSGAFYKFTSIRATAAPRTIYWTASFTFTPEDCESPATFTTPVRTLIVSPSEAELPAAKRQQEEATAAAAAKKRQEEEATATKKQEEAAAAGSVSLDGSSITVQRGGETRVRLACTGTGTCAGKLTLTVKVRSKGSRGGKRDDPKTTTLGTATFSIPAGRTATVELELNAAGRSLLGTAHGHLSATLAVLKSSPAPSQTHTEIVQLEQQKAYGKAKN
jgi:hypothetical protein